MLVAVVNRMYSEFRSECKDFLDCWDEFIISLNWLILNFLDDFFFGFKWLILNELDDVFFGFNLVVEGEELVELVSHCLEEDVGEHDELLKGFKSVAEPEAAVDNCKGVVVC